MIHRGQAGLTLIELLIVIAILGIIAAVIIPNLASFITAGNVAAANTEVENVKTGILGYYAKWNAWPTSSANLTSDTPPLISGTLKASYTIDGQYGWVVGGATNSSTGGWSGVVFCGGLSGVNGTSGRWLAGTSCPP